MIGRNVGPILGGFIQFSAYTSKLTNLFDSYRVPYFVDSALATFAIALVALKLKEEKKGMRLHGEFFARKASTPAGQGPKVKLSKAFKILLICAFANGIGVGFILPISALFFKDKFNAEPVVVSSILSSAGFIGLLAGWIAGRLSDRLGRKPLIGLGGVSARLCGFVIPFTSNLSQATFFFMVRSFGFNSYMPAMQALRADLVPAEARGRLFGLYNTFFNVGDIAGPVLSTYLYDLYRSETFHVGGLAVPGYGMPFYVHSVIGILTTAILLLFVEETRKPNS